MFNKIFINIPKSWEEFNDNLYNSIIKLLNYGIIGIQYD